MWKVLERINLTGGDNDEQHASLSFRQVITDGDMIEITSVDVLNTKGYDINLPVESYSIVAWTPGFDTKTYNLSKLEMEAATLPIEKHIDFP